MKEAQEYVEKEIRDLFKDLKDLSDYEKESLDMAKDLIQKFIKDRKAQDMEVAVSIVLNLTAMKKMELFEKVQDIASEAAKIGVKTVLATLL